MNISRTLVWLIRGLLFLNALAFLEFGIRFSIWTEYFAEQIHIHLVAPVAAADLRAFLGGLVLSIGIYFLVAIAKKAWFESSLVIVALTSLFLLAGRLYTFVLAGEVYDSHLFPVVLEIASGSAAVALLYFLQIGGRASPVERAT